MQKDTKINSYKDLIVWRKAMNLVVLIYSLSETFPKSELYCLTSQFRRCTAGRNNAYAEQIIIYPTNYNLMTTNYTTYGTL